VKTPAGEDEGGYITIVYETGDKEGFWQLIKFRLEATARGLLAANQIPPRSHRIR